MVWFDMDRKVIYEHVEYRVIEELSNNLLLVIKEEDFIENKYPILPLVIPNDTK